MSDWRNGSNKDSGRNQGGSGRKPGRPIPMPPSSAVPGARSDTKANEASSQDWRGNAKKGTAASKSQDRTWTGSGRETPTSTSGLRKAVLLAGLAIAISVTFLCYWFFVFKHDPRLPVIVSIAPDYTTLDLGQSTFRNHDFGFEQKFVHVLPEPQKPVSGATRKLEPDERFLEEVRKNDKWGEGWGIPSSYRKGDSLLGGGPSRRVTAYFVSSLIARESSPEVIGSDIAEDGNSKEQWVLITKDDDPFDPSTEKLLTVNLLLERIANRTAEGSLALVVLDVKPPTVVTNLGDLEFPKSDLENAFDSLSDSQKNKLCVCLPCDSGQESWYAPEYKTSVFAHFFWKGISSGFDNSDRKWTLREFKSSLQMQVSQWVAQHRFAQQTPTFLMSDITMNNEDTLLLVETTGGESKPQSSEIVRTLLTTRYQSLEGLWDDYASLQHCLYSNPLQYATIESGLIQMEDLAEYASDKAWTEFEGRVKEVIEELNKSSKFDRRVSLVEARQHRKFLNDSSAFSDSSYDECLKVWNRLEDIARNKDQGKWSEAFKKSSLQEAIRECMLDPKRVPTEWLEVRLLKLIHESMGDKSDGQKSAEAIAGLIRMSSNLSSIAFDPCVELSSWNRENCSEFEYRFAESFDHFFANEWDTCITKLATMQKDFDLFSEKCKLLKSAMRTRNEALWLVPHLLAAQLRMSRHVVSEEGKIPEVEEIGKLLQDAIALRDLLSDEQASIEEKLKSEAETKLAKLKSKLTETFSEVVRKEEDAETLPISRIALRWPLLSLDIRKSLHSRLATLYGAPKDDNASSVSNQTSWSSLTPRQVGSDFRRKLRLGLEGSNLEASGGYYDRIVFNDPRYSVVEIEKNKSKSQAEPSTRQMIYQETYRTRMVANAFGQRAITKDLATKFWPWNSPDQMQAVNTASYNLLQTQRLCISRWGDSDLDNPKLQKLYFERMLTEKGSITKPFLPIVQMLPGFDQARSVLVELEKMQADALNRASQEVNGLGVAASLFPPKQSDEVSPISLTIEPSDWTAYATLSIHRENSSERIPFTESSPSSSMGYPLSNTKPAEAIPKKLDPNLVGSQLRLSVRGHFRKCDLLPADAVDSFEIESKSPTLPSTVLVTASNAEPITLWILLDCSGSMEHENIFKDAKSAAITLLQRVMELNEKEESPIKVGFIVFGRKPDANRPAILSESKIGNQIFQTTLKEGAAIGELVDLINLGWIRPSGCTPLYDAIYTACGESANDGRNWIVVISDGSNGLDLPGEEKIDKETGKKILDPNAYYHNNGNKQDSDVQAKVIQSKSKLFVYQKKNDDYYRKATDPKGKPRFSDEQKAAFANANQELKDLISRLPKSNKDSKLFYDSFQELQSDLIALLPVSTVKITDSDGKQLGQEPFDTHTFGNPISIQVAKPTQATITVNSRGDTKDFPIWLTGGEKLVFKYSDSRGLRAIPFKDDKNAFGNFFPMARKDGGKSDIRVKATNATDEPYRLVIQFSKRGDVGETAEETKFVRRPGFLIASISPAESSISPAESSMAEAFWVCDHLFKPNTHYPIIQLPSIPWEQGNKWRSEELKVNVWLAEDIPKKAKRIQLDAGAQSDKLAPFTCVRVDDRVTVKVAPGSEVKPGAERYFVLCNNDLKAVRTYEDGLEAKIEFNVPESQPAELMVVTWKELLAWESEGALKHYYTDKSLRFLK